LLVALVGYGDYTVKECGGGENTVIMLLGMVYVLMGVILFGALIAEFAAYIMEIHEERRLTVEYIKQFETRGYFAEIIYPIFQIIAVVAIGTAAMMYLEDQTWIDSFYWSLVTVTTVGYGDMEITNNNTRLFCCVFIVVSVSVVTSSIGHFSQIALDMLHDARRKRLYAMKLTPQLIEKMDLDGDGGVSEGEFLTFMLIQEGLVSQYDCERHINHFRELDKDGSGELDVRDLTVNAEEDGINSASVAAEWAMDSNAKTPVPAGVDSGAKKIVKRVSSTHFREKGVNQNSAIMKKGKTRLPSSLVGKQGTMQQGSFI
jgi:potassium channel subfamily K